MAMLAAVGARTMRWVEEFGDLCVFSGQAVAMVPRGLRRWHHVRLLVRQMYDVGTCSLPVVMITGMFVGMVLAVQTVQQFMNVGLEGQLGPIVNLSVTRELGPVLAGVMLAGRVGGAFTAELGTMRVTEQLDALRAMGVDPIRYLVVPRLLACLLLGPFLVIYADVMGAVGGYYISVFVYGVNPSLYWPQGIVQFFDISLGLIKSVFFTGVMALICCHKAFRCEAGAAGVGRACTEAFVASCMTVLGLDFFLGVLLNAIHNYLFGFKSLLG